MHRRLWDKVWARIHRRARGELGAPPPILQMSTQDIERALRALLTLALPPIANSWPTWEQDQSAFQTQIDAVIALFAQARAKLSSDIAISLWMVERGLVVAYWVTFVCFAVVWWRFCSSDYPTTIWAGLITFVLTTACILVGVIALRDIGSAWRISIFALVSGACAFLLLLAGHSIPLWARAALFGPLFSLAAVLFDDEAVGAVVSVRLMTWLQRRRISPKTRLIMALIVLTAVLAIDESAETDVADTPDDGGLQVMDDDPIVIAVMAEGENQFLSDAIDDAVYNARRIVGPGRRRWALQQRWESNELAGLLDALSRPLLLGGARRAKAASIVNRLLLACSLDRWDDIISLREEIPVVQTLFAPGERRLLASWPAFVSLVATIGIVVLLPKARSIDGILQVVPLVTFALTMLARMPAQGEKALNLIAEKLASESH